MITILIVVVLALLLAGIGVALLPKRELPPGSPQFNFEERAPGTLRQAVLAALADEAEKERTLDEEARRMMETARTEIASGRVDGQELFRRIRRKLAEQRGIVL